MGRPVEQRRERGLFVPAYDYGQEEVTLGTDLLLLCLCHKRTPEIVIEHATPSLPKKLHFPREKLRKTFASSGDTFSRKGHNVKTQDSRKTALNVSTFYPLLLSLAVPLPNLSIAHLAPKPLVRFCTQTFFKVLVRSFVLFCNVRYRCQTASNCGQAAVFSFRSCAVTSRVAA